MNDYDNIRFTILGMIWINDGKGSELIVDLLFAMSALIIIKSCILPYMQYIGWPDIHVYIYIFIECIMDCGMLLVCYYYIGLKYNGAVDINQWVN